MSTQALKEAEEALKQAQPQEAGQALTIKEAFEHVGGYWTGEDKLCPTFGSGMALKAYTIKMQRNAVDISKAAAPAPAVPVEAQPPIDMILHCPNCGLQHIDEVEAPDNAPAGFIPGETLWTNPPHRSHLCHGCNHIWRPADIPTNGVASIKTKGENDSNPAPAVPSVPGKYAMSKEQCIAYAKLEEQAGDPDITVMPPSALTDEEVWDIYKHAVNKVRRTGSRKFAIALTREIIRLSTPASVPSDEHPLSGLYINQGSMDAAADAYAAEYEAAKEERFMAIKRRKRELETEVSDLRNTLRARESEREKAQVDIKDRAMSEDKACRVQVGTVKFDGDRPQIWFDGRPVFGPEDWDADEQHIKRFCEWVAGLAAKPAVPMPKFTKEQAEHFWETRVGTEPPCYVEEFANLLLAQYAAPTPPETAKEQDQ